MIILVAFATVEGQTRKIASHIGAQIEKEGHQAVLLDVAGPGFGLPGRMDAVILCGPIHIGRYPAQLVSFVANWKAELQALPSALVTVSLAIASKNKEEQEEARTFPRQITAGIGWQPDYFHHAAGALKYVEYDFFKRWMLRRIAASEGGPVDTSRDHELTDWLSLDKFVAGFLDFAARTPVD
ncbi:MAG: flavodoxin domain-containing protein [Nitratireductor sp.]